MPKFDWSNLGPFVQAVKTACGAGAMSMGTEVKDDVNRHFGSVRFFSSRPGTPPNIQRNGLRKSMQVQASGKLTAIVGSSAFYGWIQESGNEGRPITAKKTKYLPVPINPAARRLMERKGEQSLRAMGTFRLIKPLFGKNALLIGDKKQRANISYDGADGKRKEKNIGGEPVFVLKKSIRLPKRPFMAPALKRARGNKTLVNVFAVGATKSLVKSKFNVKVVPA